MSYLRALKFLTCTKCFACCYTALKEDQELTDKMRLPFDIKWFHVPIFDGVYGNVAICNFTIINNNQQPICFLQVIREKPKVCQKYKCWR